MNTPEINKDTKIKLPLSVVVGLSVFAFTLGGIAAEVLNNDEQRDEMKLHLEGEINGLRSDWNRDRIAQEKRFDKLEK